MGGLRKALWNWWVISLVTAILVALILALALPIFVGPLRPWWARLLLVLLVAAVWGLLALWRVLAARKAARKLSQGLATAEPADAEQRVQAERMREALGKLRAASGKRQDYLYSRPWYVIIGPPGAGKTTALLNSGLRFPYSETALKGVGGTRNLDFWFADEAVLVDTAGRYTTQDSDTNRDREAWRGFLSLLKKHRPLQPLNGVIVAIALDELIGADVTRIDAHAGTVRRRIAELEADLEIAAPVYVVFTKADLIAGFSEYFDDLDVEGRRAVLGSTFPAQGQTPDAAKLALAMDEIVQSVADRGSGRLQQELDARRRGLVIGFPAQLAATRARVVRFLEGVFPPDRERLARFRGFYFTSGVQQGTPLDRILSGIAPVYDAPAAPARQGGGRAYFLNRLLQEVIVPEAGLVRGAPGAEARRRTALSTGIAAIAVVSLVVAALWTVSFVANRRMQDRVLAQAAAAREEARVQGLELTEVSASDPTLEQSLDFLDKLRRVPGVPANGRAPLTARFGLYQSGLARTALQTYREALNRVLLPRVLLRLEQRLGESGGDAMAVYEPLKIYLMLGGQKPGALDKTAVRDWIAADWADDQYPRADQGELRKRLEGHLQALLDDPGFGRAWSGGRAPLDANLIEARRSDVQAMAPGERAYAVLKHNAAAAGDEWRAQGIIDEGKARAFADPEGVRGLAVPFFFTHDGFEKAFQSGLNNVEREIRDDAWVLGENAGSATGRAQLDELKDTAAEHYAEEYVQAWDAVLARLKPADYFADPVAGNAIRGRPSPLKTVLQAVATQTDFSPTKGGGSGALGKAVTDRAGKLGQAAVMAKRMRGGNAGYDAGAVITAHFQPVRDYVSAAGGPAPIDDFLDKLARAIAAKSTAGAIGGGLGAEGAVGAAFQAMSELQGAAAQAPGALQAFAAAAAQQGGAAQRTVATGAITDQYRSVLASCVGATEKQYPFMRTSAADAKIVQLMEVFGPSGTFNGFVDGQLERLLERTGPQWRWRSDDPLAATFEPSTPEQFQKADELGKLLIGGMTIQVEPEEWSPDLEQVELSVDGVPKSFTPARKPPQPVRWTPGSSYQASVRLTAKGQEVLSLDRQGPWALFRLFDAGRRENAGPTAFRVTFGESANYVTFKVSLPEPRNPFGAGGVWAFKCPARL